MKLSRKFMSCDQLRTWFYENHLTCPGIWIRFENSGSSMVSEDDALKTAICFGWIDDRIKRIGDTSYRKKFIPRREKSVWTESQKAIVSELKKHGLMEKPGLDAISRAKSDGTWNSSPSLPLTDSMLESFSVALRPYEPAFSNFLRLHPSSQRTHALNYCSAKRPETRARRLATIVSKLNSESLHKGNLSNTNKT